MQAKIARVISLMLIGLFVLVPLMGCGGGGETPPPDNGDIIDPDKPTAPDILFKGRIDLVPEVEVRFVDRNLRNERLSDAPLSEDPVFEIITQAQKSLEIAVMRINRQEFVEALLRQSAIVKIRIVTESAYYNDPNYKPFYQQLEDPAKNNGNIEIRTDLEGAPRMMHSRFMIVDNSRTVLGSYDWSAAGATNTVGDVVILKDSRITAAFRNQFEQMFSDRLFGTLKRDATQHSWQVGGGFGRVDVYFGPTDDLRSLIQSQIEASAAIGFNIKEFADVDFANFILNWTFGTNRFTGAPHIMSAIINDLSVNTTPEEQAIYEAFYARVIGDEDVEGSGGMTTSAIISYNPFPSTVSNHKYLVCDRDEVTGGADPPSVVTGSANWTTSSFDFNDECIVILYGNPLVSRYLGFVNPLAPRFQDFDGEVRPEDFGEFFPNFLQYPTVGSPDAPDLEHNVPMAIVYGLLPNFKRDVILGIGTGTTPPPSMTVDILFEVSGTTYLNDIEYPAYEIDNFDPFEATNPEKGYVITVPAGKVTVLPILMDASSGTRILGANNPIYELEVGPGGVRRLDMSVGSPPQVDTGDGGSGGGGTGGT